METRTAETTSLELVTGPRYDHCRAGCVFLGRHGYADLYIHPYDVEAGDALLVVQRGDGYVFAETCGVRRYEAEDRDAYGEDLGEAYCRAWRAGYIARPYAPAAQPHLPHPFPEDVFLGGFNYLTYAHLNPTKWRQAYAELYLRRPTDGGRDLLLDRWGTLPAAYRAQELEGVRAWTQHPKLVRRHSMAPFDEALRRLSGAPPTPTLDRWRAAQRVLGIHHVRRYLAWRDAQAPGVPTDAPAEDELLRYVDVDPDAMAHETEQLAAYFLSCRTAPIPAPETSHA